MGRQRASRGTATPLQDWDGVCEALSLSPTPWGCDSGPRRQRATALTPRAVRREAHDMGRWGCGLNYPAQGGARLWGRERGL